MIRILGHNERKYMGTNKQIIIVLHSLFSGAGNPISGTGASLFDLFDAHRIPFQLIHLPIYGGHMVLVQQHTNKKITQSEMRCMPKSLGIRTILEAGIILSVIGHSKATDIFIGIDPLNAFWGLIGKHFFRKVGHVIYYTADYADKRFDNPVINWIYHGIDRLCIRYADQVWNVSTRIQEKRSSQGVPAGKNYFVPNSPVSTPKRHTNYHKYWMTIVGTSTTALEYAAVLDAMPRLVQIYPNIRLHIVGELQFSAALRGQIAGMLKNKMVVLHGSMERSLVQKLLAKSGIGLALYKDKDPWTRYGDSMKMREYLSCGLPIITTSVVSTSDVVLAYRCGKVIKPTAENFIAAVKEIYSPTYMSLRSGALSAAKQYAFARMARQPLSLVGITV